jgi:hypothetical protein
MDNVKISDLPITTNIQDGNSFVLVQNGVTKKIAWGSLRPAFYDATPVGTYISGAWETAPSGYVMCDGSAISRTDYANLFACIGEKFGVGDGSTTFNVPDLRDKTIQGRNANQTIGESLEAGLPNITGYFSLSPNPDYTGASGCFRSRGGGGQRADFGPTGSYPSGANFDASKSNAIYGNSDTVQPPALVVNFAIKI